MLGAVFHLDFINKSYILLLPMDTRHYSIALASINGVGSVTYKRLIAHFGGAEAVFRATKRELSGIEGLGRSRASAITSFDGWGAVQDEVGRATGAGVSIIGLEDTAYPARLREIYDAPPILYLKGSLIDRDERAVAVVGSRNSSRYGLISAEGIARGLAARGITVVSGMARGIDSAAHIGTLREKGRTIAVLGSGIDVIYPSENRPLFHEIVEHGAVITEFPFGTEPEMTNFPRRNRIISGISLGVVIVEASPKSGALITAKLALEHNREVFAVPGNITSMRSRGTHSLIREGAKLVESAEDIIEELEFALKGTPAGRSDKGQPAALAGDLSDTQRTVLRCVENGPVCIDAIIEGSGFKSQEVLTILLDLELKGLVKQISGNNFILNTFNSVKI
ncbi:MAG: DNA-processing protein DprA [Deltaproteobacteria bacterium]|nr:DNA-processing protein DprA [Candidatus Zymogenaceae bacterium]